VAVQKLFSIYKSQWEPLLPLTAALGGENIHAQLFEAVMLLLSMIVQAALFGQQQ
jgi:hypothetical protein